MAPIGWGATAKSTRHRGNYEKIPTGNLKTFSTGYLKYVSSLTYWADQIGFFYKLVKRKKKAVPIHPALLPIQFLNDEQQSVAFGGQGDQEPLLGPCRRSCADCAGDSGAARQCFVGDAVSSAF